MQIEQFITESLGDASYLIVSGQSAVALDPQRDIRPFEAAAERLGATIDFVVETHVHNDYLSGGRELAAKGAKVVVPRDSGIEFPHLAIGDGEDLELGGARLRAVHAPGHTYHHTAYLAIDEDGQTAGAFTGGSILMAAAGRTDLLGDDHSERLTRLQWDSAARLAQLLSPGNEIYPTHGAGSFCSASGTTSDRHAILRVEKSRNPLFTSAGYDDFRDIQLSDPAPVPGYYQYMSPLNRQGPAVHGTPPLPPRLDVDAIGQATPGTHVVDVRNRQDHAAGKIPGSMLIESSGSMLAYFGWLVPFNAPLMLIADNEEHAAGVTLDLFRIGYEDVRGFLTLDQWQRDGNHTESIDAVNVDEAARIVHQGNRPVLDVRFAGEAAKTPLDHAISRPIDQFHEWAPSLPDAPYLVVCESGYRATTAASLLQNRGMHVTALIEGGATDLRERLGARTPSHTA